MGIKIEIHHTNERGDFARTLFPAKVRYGGLQFIVPAGFEFDGASIPRFCRGLIGSPLDPEIARGGRDHDYIYRFQPPGWTRKKADLMFLCHLLEDGLPPGKAFVAYRFVRLFGWIAWRDNTAILKVWRGKE